MKHFLQWTISLLLMMQLANAQVVPLDRQRHADSLERAMRTAPTDSSKARAAYLLAEFWAKSDTTKAAYYMKRGKQLADDTPYFHALHQYHIGQFYFKTNRPLSEAAYLRADSIINKHNLAFKSAYALAGACWHNYALLQQFKDDIETTISIIVDKVIPYHQKARIYPEVAWNYAEVGILFSNEQEYEKAAIYFEEALTMLDTLSIDAAPKAYIYLAAVRNFLMQEELDQAKRYQDSAAILLTDYKETTYYLSYLENEAQYHRRRAEYQKALQYLESGIKLADRLGNTYDREGLLNEKSKLFIFQQRYREAHSILKYLSEHTVTPFAATRMIYYKNRSEVAAKLGNYPEAYHWLNEYSTVSDSLNDTRLKERIFQLEAKFQHAESQHKIASLTAQKSAVELKARNNQLFVWVSGLICVGLLLVAAFSIIYYREQKQLGKQMAINHEQKVRELDQQRELAVTRAILDGEEQERQRIARDLHDGLGGMLAGVKINLSGWAANNLDNPRNDSFYKVISQLDSSVTELRRIARNMMPETLLKFGLETALHDLCEFYATDDIHVDFQAFELDNKNSLAFQITIYRIVQELLTNAIRHGKSTNIVVQCSQSDNDFIIVVEDNGMGFDKTVLEQKKGIGLSNIKSRVSYYWGEMELITAPGEGTTVHIELHDHGEG